MQAAFTPTTNITTFFYDGYQSTLTLGGSNSAATTGKSSAEHKITPSDGSAGWSLNLDSYTYNGSAVSMATATKIAVS